MDKKRFSLYRIIGTSHWSHWIKTAILLTMILTLLLFSGCDSNDNPKPIPDTLTVEEIVQKTGPSVVNIYSNKSLGSGVIYKMEDGYGYIITNDHVVRGANALSVRLSDKRTLKAKLIGTDPRRDVAVIKVEGDNLPVADFADYNKVKIGADVVAIGNARGIENSVTKGIISNVDIDVDTGTNIRRCLQTDTPINPGNSGGALVNMSGEVIGINEMGRNDAESMNYAIPGSDAKKMADQLISKGYVSYPYLGIDAVNKEAKDGTKFIWIRNIMDNSPAAKAGLRKNDAIMQVNDVRVETVSKLREQLNVSGIGSMVSIYIIRRTNQGGQKGVKQVTLEELPKGYYTIDWS